ncbi:hypothetical protein FRB99_005426 [Tulasnella sp. 403]|nr:hypothetical protein FRB99_005426 [Tulasnella sp. 403]
MIDSPTLPAPSPRPTDFDPSRTVTPSIRSFDSRLSRHTTPWWGHIRPFRGMLADVRARFPYYISDWTDAWNYRVVPATAMIFFANILPAIAFSLDLIETTGQYGVVEVLLSSFMAAFVFSVFSCQPLCIAGVTGPITVLNKTIYDILRTREDAPDYLQFIGWVYLWAAILHWIAASLNAANFLRYVTRFSCDTFGFYVSWVYLQYGVQVLTRQFHESSVESAYVSIILALVMLVTGHLFVILSQSTFFHRVVRRFFADYGMPISGTFVSLHALAYWGHFNASNPATLPTAGAFQPAGGRKWLIRFWELPAKWVGIAFPFGIALFFLFFFDHNVSSLIAQGSEFPLRKPPGFHWDFFWLGITTFIAGLVGVPAPNGLIPQAPMHTQSLVVTGVRSKDDEEIGQSAEGEKALGCVRGGVEHPIAVVEQRGKCLAYRRLSISWFMGTDALRGSGVTAKLAYLIRDDALVPTHSPLRHVRTSRIWMFVLIELLGFGATMAITQTIAAIGFPVVILLLVPVRMYVVPLLPFTPEELAVLDGPTASPFPAPPVVTFRPRREEAKRDGERISLAVGP